MTSLELNEGLHIAVLTLQLAGGRCYASNPAWQKIRRAEKYIQAQLAEIDQAILAALEEEKPLRNDDYPLPF
jgi:hypothetical protein